MQIITINQLNDLLAKGSKIQAIVSDVQMPRLTSEQIAEISPSTHDYFKRIQQDHNLPLVKVNVYKPNGSSYKIAGTYVIKDANFLVTATALQQTATNHNTEQHIQTPNLQGVSDYTQQHNNYVAPKNPITQQVATNSNTEQQIPTTILPLPTTKPIIMSDFNGLNKVLEFQLNFTTEQNTELKKRVRELELANENCTQENLKLLRTSALAGDRHAFELEKQANQIMAENKSGFAGFGSVLSENKDVIMELAGMAKEAFMQSRTAPAIAGVSEPLHNNPDASEAIKAINQQFKPLATETVGKLYLINEYLIKNPNNLEATYNSITKPTPTA